ncbi:(-)-alpha-terpineol synthase [Thalictrum thalictroides]|uniref:(-)-alpha-terpineol synthase n=1 Tax=Thalictrum thalictroides TaxID=46969 RepID=A0A7J6WQH9_THATH|nr:(-)-alpha-terpineol synthase [Thalictrum thalictroides]
MALHLCVITSPSSSKCLSLSKFLSPKAPSNSHLSLGFRRFSIPETTSHQTVPLRTEHFQYQPTIWDYDFVESLQSSFVGETCTNKTEKLKEDVRILLKKAVGSLAQFELIDVLGRLGIGHLFEDDIKTSLSNVYNDNDRFLRDDNLYATALTFRVFRQHGFKVSQDVFKIYMDETGKFNESVCQDVKGLLSLYEASHLVAGGEKILDKAISFTTNHLKAHLDKGITEPNLAAQVSRSLEIPMHWRMLRSEAKWYMDVYAKEKSMNPTLLQLAKMDFNMVQATLQTDLRNMSRWWRNLGVATKLPFARDRLVESFLWSVGIAYEPQYARCREWLTKVMNFVLVIDDIYDVYGSVDELELFTEAVERWDHTAMDKLPYYMKICFLALYNMTNDMAYEVLKEQGCDILPYLTKSWANFIKAMLVEAKWFNTGYTPSLQEYINNGWLSSSGSVFLVHAFFATNQKINSEVLEGLDKNHDLLYCSSMMFRLSNDLATSSAELERGDVASSVGCYMREANASEVDAQKHIRGLIMDTWKKMNKSIFESPFDTAFVNIAINLARTSLFIYQYGDGLGVEDSQSKEHILSLIVNPVEIKL